MATKAEKQFGVDDVVPPELQKEMLKESKRWMVTIVNQVLMTVFTMLIVFLPALVDLPPEMVLALSENVVTLVVGWMATSGLNMGSFVISRGMRNTKTNGQ